MLPEEVVSLPDELDEIYLRFADLGVDVIDRPERYQNRDDFESSSNEFDKKEDETTEFGLATHERPTTRCACNCARRAPFPSSTPRARWRSARASSQAEGRSTRA